MRLHYGRTTYDGRPVEDVTRTPIMEEIEQATAAVQAAKGEEETLTDEQKVSRSSADRAMEAANESTGFGAVAKIFRLLNRVVVYRQGNNVFRAKRMGRPK